MLYRWIDLALAITCFGITTIAYLNGIPLATLAGLAATTAFAYLALRGQRSRRPPTCQICDRELTSDHALCYWCRQKFE